MNTYTFHISPYDLAFLGTIFIGLTFAALLFFTKSINQPAKRLFGLATLAVIKRVKEIGIRKVLGASVANIVSMLSKDFLILIIISLVIASPIAYYFMHRWLQDFAYRINISWWMFALAGLAAILIALITVSFQSVKAALANPVKSLKTE